ncbi:YchJ family protein [Flavobacterium sp. J27]|uniref:YchJ family protein n=1 Tax=Flavobacterium sp. J27 TaxID=2060419 RepID=UPI0010304172|nr:YchJ family metal-binding protein [Flavobacterium sp. J27]
MKSCFCGSGNPFEVCCEPFLQGTKIPLFPEQLMRSRYTAYVVQNASYLLNTTHVSQRKLYSKNEILKWAKANTWVKLEVIRADKAIVEFKAYYLDERLQPQIHHEKSTFKQEAGKWFYVDGQFY